MSSLRTPLRAALVPVPIAAGVLIAAASRSCADLGAGRGGPERRADRPERPGRGRRRRGRRDDGVARRTRRPRTAPCGPPPTRSAAPGRPPRTSRPSAPSRASSTSPWTRPATPSPCGPRTPALVTRSSRRRPGPAGGAWSSAVTLSDAAADSYPAVGRHRRRGQRGGRVGQRRDGTAPSSVPAKSLGRWVVRDRSRCRTPRTAPATPWWPWPRTAGRPLSGPTSTRPH